MKKVYFRAIAICVFSFAISANAQTPTPQPKTEDVVKISTTLIQVDATVTDRKGKIVRDLKAEDFEIFENGQRQKISNFLFVEPNGPPDAAEPNVNVHAREKGSSAEPPLPIKLKNDQIKRTIALVVDDLDLSFSSIANVRDSLKKFVDQQMKFGDLVAIIRTGSGAGFLQQFTSDKRILYTAIEHIRWNSRGAGNVGVFLPRDPSDKGATGAASPDLGSGVFGPDDLAKAMAATSESGAENLRAQQESFREEIFAVGTLGAVNYVVEGMSRLPGRKAIVLFSEGFVLYQQDMNDRSLGIKRVSTRLTAAMRSLSEAANRSGVIIYPIDARGVVNGLMLDAQDSFDDLDYSGGASQMQSTSMQRSTELTESQQGLRALAEGTGGFATINNNDLNQGIQRVLNDQSGYYLIGYQPNEGTFDPKKLRFNQLSVKVSRPDVRVRYRNGFYGITENEGSAKPKTAREQIYGALASPLNIGEFKLQLASFFANDASTGNFIRTLIYVDGGSLTFTDDGNGWQSARYDVVAMLFGEKDQILDEISRKQTIKATAATLKEIKEKGFVATISVPVKKPGAYQMRVVVRDDVTSKLGSANEFIQVPNIRKDQLYVSGLLLQRSDLNTASAASANRQFQTDEFRDIAMRTFHPGTRLRLGFGVYNARSADLSIRYRIYRNGVAVYSSPEKKITTMDRADLRRIVAEDEFKLSQTIKPGTYILQMIVSDGSAAEKSRTTYQFVDFEIVP